MAKTKTRKRKHESSDEEEEEDGPDNFQVEVILAARVANEDDHEPWEYLVKWAGYGEGDNTWEPARNVAPCQRLLGSFWLEIGLDNKDYPVGHTCKPSKKWIKREKEIFKDEYAKEKEEKRKQQERKLLKEEKRLTEAKAKKKNKIASAAASRSASTSSARPSTIQSVPSNSSASTSAPAKKKQKMFIPDSDSDDDEPLAKLKKRKASSSDADPDDDEPLAKLQKRKASSSSADPKKSAAQKSTDKPAPPAKGGEPSGKEVQDPPNPAAALFSTPSPPASPEVIPKPVSAKPLPSGRPAPKPLPSKSSTLPASKTATTAPPTASTSMKSAPSASSSSSIPAPPRRRRPDISKGVAAPSASSQIGKDKGSTATSKPPTPIIPPVQPSSKPPTPVIAPPPKPSGVTPATTPTIPSTVPAHVQRKGSAPSRTKNPLSAIPSSSSGSGLSTKQRLAQGALNLAAPSKETTTRKSNLSGLTFRKNTSNSASNAGESGSNRPRMPPPPPPPPPPPIMDPLFDDPTEMPLVASPASIHDDEEQSLLTGSLSRRPSQASLETQADDLLKDILPISARNPAELASPVMDLPPDPPRQKRFPTIQKKWRWTGQLLMDSGKGKEPEQPCNVVLEELSPANFTGLRIDDVMSSMDSIHLLSFHDLVDMSQFLKTCLPVEHEKDRPILDSHIARLGPSSAAKDAAAFKILARYMTKKNQISLVPVFENDGPLVGHLFVFPPSMKILNEMFRVSSSMVTNSLLLVALLPWKTFPEEFRRPFGTLPQSPQTRNRDWKKNMLRTKYQVALRVLKFPTDLHAWISREHRLYHVWDDKKSTGIRETAYLTAILDQCKATRVDFKTDVRVVFIHIGSLKTFHKIPLSVERRAQTSGIRFYTFGTHETVHPSRWGVREVYPFGGIVTFTPSALVQDPWGVINKIKALHKHPLWMGYILPSTLGMATRLVTGGEDALAAFDNGSFVFDLILKAIDEGEVSLLRAPDSDPQWLQEHSYGRPHTQRGILEYCINTFNAKCSKMDESQWNTTVEAEISKDLNMMQQQPVIMDNYRRYVVITGDNTSSPADGAEWTQLADFYFNDKFLENM
ncbi:hypothetical protein FB45DRAFT_916103 [Roridomyces roridus]|uniref:Chromo domain-containing protein n=1 Tax=Roridomyces roridus TaxID=1738132 RepID=A0AAD7BTW2_9AGAR|nr:hypothetical protein FB45DRAFT_916103 [Roridomyces roridus]